MQVRERSNESLFPLGDRAAFDIFFGVIGLAGEAGGVSGELDEGDGRGVGEASLNGVDFGEVFFEGSER